MEKTIRPTSVTVAAVLILIGAGLGLLATRLTPLLATVPESRQAMEAAGMSVTYAIVSGVVSGIVYLISGIAILEGINWGRWLSLCFLPISFLAPSAFFVAGGPEHQKVGS